MTAGSLPGPAREAPVPLTVGSLRNWCGGCHLHLASVMLCGAAAASRATPGRRPLIWTHSANGSELVGVWAAVSPSTRLDSLGGQLRARGSVGRRESASTVRCRNYRTEPDGCVSSAATTRLQTN